MSAALHDRRGDRRSGTPQLSPSVSRRVGSEAHLLALQRQVGNRAVTALVAQRDALNTHGQRPPNAALDLLIPDFALPLTPAAIRRIQRHLDAGRFQLALNACVAACESIGAVDSSLLNDARFTYIENQQGGVTRTAWRHYFEKPRGPWRMSLESQRVIIGRSAMDTVSMLHSVIMHEWQHVRMTRRWIDQPLLAAPEDERIELKRLPGLTDRGRNVWKELDAYCWQIENAQALGSTLREIHMFKVGLEVNAGTELALLDTLPDQIAQPALQRYRRALALAHRLLRKTAD